MHLEYILCHKMSIAQKVLNEKTIKEKLDINYVMVIKGFLITYSLKYPEGRENLCPVEHCSHLLAEKAISTRNKKEQEKTHFVMDDSPVSPVGCNSFEAGSLEKRLFGSMLLKPVSYFQLVPPVSLTISLNEEDPPRSSPTFH